MNHHIKYAIDVFQKDVSIYSTVYYCKLNNLSALKK